MKPKTLTVMSSGGVNERKKWYSREEAASFLGLSTSCLAQWATEGKKEGNKQKIPFYRTGNKVQYDIEDLLMYNKTHRVKIE